MKKIVLFLLFTYLFWAGVSFVNVNYLLPLVVPGLFLMVLHTIVERFPALLGPLLLGVLVSALLPAIVGKAVCTRLRDPAAMLVLACLTNGSCLGVFLLAADVQKNRAITAQLAQRKPECVHVNSFFTSLENAGDGFFEHALFKEGGKTFYWSYSKMGFFEGNERLDPNFPCRPSKK